MADENRPEATAPSARRERLHRIANLVAIALANLEAMADGALDPSSRRYANVCDALRSAGGLIEEEQRDS